MNMSLGFGFVPQEPWIQNGSIRSNILFGCEYNHGRYKEVLEACGLTEDLSNFTDSDDKNTGEEGAALSGGQKARIGLARAVYQVTQKIS